MFQQHLQTKNLYSVTEFQVPFFTLPSTNNHIFFLLKPLEIFPHVSLTLFEIGEFNYNSLSIIMTCEIVLNIL